MRLERAALCVVVAAVVWSAAAALAQDIPRPVWVRSGEVNEDGAVVYSAPDQGAPRRGTVALGTRLALGKLAKGQGCGDFRFVQVGDEAFMCERDLTPTKLDPGGVTQPLMAAEALLPYEYLFVTSEGIGGYARPSDLEADDFAIVLTQDFGIVARERATYEGVPLVRSAHGFYVRESELRARPTSAFAGVKIEDGRLDSFGWVVKERVARKGVPSSKAAAKLPRLSLVRFVEQHEQTERGNLRLQDGGHVMAREVVRPQPLVSLPAGLAAGERFIDVDTVRQTLVVYEGSRPIFATLVSTGLPATDTPIGVFRIWAKLTTSDMNDTERADQEHNYSIESVPWVQFFHESIALHAAFWHDRFGEKHSHGCVNLSPRDARTVFELTQPALPAGYYAILPTAKSLGTTVIVR